MISICIVGCGNWGMNHIRIFNELPESCVVAACDERKERLTIVQQRYPQTGLFNSLAEALEEQSFDAVVVATPVSTHMSIAKEALSAHKHVLIEKPMVNSAIQARELIELAGQNQVTLMVGHTYLYNDGVLMMKEQMKSKSFGDVYYLDSTRTNIGRIYDDINALWDLAPHDIAVFAYLLNQWPMWVSAVGTKVLGQSQEDVGFITLGFSDNVLGRLHVSRVHPSKTRQIVSVGSKRRVVFNDLDPLEPIRVFEKGISKQAQEADTFGEFKLLIRDGDILSPKVAAKEPLKTECSHFLECIINSSRPLSDGNNGLNVVLVMEAIDKSMALSGAPVEVKN